MRGQKSMNRLETETIINFNDEDDFAEIYSCQAKIWTRMKRMGIEPVEVKKGYNGKVIYKTFQVPVKWVVIRKPKRIGKNQRDPDRASRFYLRQPPAVLGSN